MFPFFSCMFFAEICFTESRLLTIHDIMLDPETVKLIGLDQFLCAPF